MTSSPYRFSLGTSPTDFASFFAPRPGDDQLLALRAADLRDNPSPYAALLPPSDPLLDETLELLADWLPPQVAAAPDRAARLLALGASLVPDLVWLVPHPASATWIVVGGVVCFPSHWRLTDKLNLPLAMVHDPVPGLNDQLASLLDRLLAGLKPHRPLRRWNWGLASSPEPNQHPDRHLPTLSPPFQPDQTWLRREEQLLIKLPRSEGVLFGIRIHQMPWAKLLQSPDLRAELVRDLRTMPAPLLAYKRLDALREDLLAALQR